MSNNEKAKSALVVEGGAMRGVFSTGVLDAFIEHDFYPFDMCFGVSAGSTNIAAYLARMHQRNYNVYIDYSTRKEFISIKKFLKGHHLIDLDWLWDITIKELRLDLDEIITCDTEFYIGLTEVETGKSVYLNPTRNNLEDMIKASSCVPIMYRHYVELDGKLYADGGLADPISVKEAYKRGAKNIMVIRSRPYDFKIKDRTNFVSKYLFRKFPELYKTYRSRANMYEETLDFMRNAPDDVTIIEVNPPKTFKTRALTRDKTILKSDYQSGYEMGLELIKEWEQKK